MDSTWLELKGTFNVLCSFVKTIKGRKVRHRTDKTKRSACLDKWK